MRKRGGRLREAAERMATICGDYPLASDVVAYDPERREQLWKACKALYPTLYRFDPRKKPINFVDDVVVRAERISELIRYLEEFFGSQRVPVAIFGHIGNGNAHIAPLDVNDKRDFDKMVQAIMKFTRPSWTGLKGPSAESMGTVGCVPSMCGRCSGRSCTTCS